MDTTHLEAFYNDSLGVSIDSSLPNLRQILKNHNINHIIDFQQRQQFNGYDCGPWAVFNLDSIAREGLLPITIEQGDIIRQRDDLRAINNTNYPKPLSISEPPQPLILKAEINFKQTADLDKMDISKPEENEMGDGIIIQRDENDQSLADASIKDSEITDPVIKDLKLIAPYLSKKDCVKVVSTLSSLGPESGRVNILQDAIELTFPQQFEYYRNDKFFQYAFPEGQIDNELYKDLHQSGYTSTIMNQLIRNLRQKYIANNEKDNNIILLDSPTLDLVSKNDLGNYLKSAVKAFLGSDIYGIQSSQAVIILPFIFKSHWYSTVIHLSNKVDSISKIRVILNNPYGAAHFDEETHKNIEEQIKQFASRGFLDDKVDFAMLRNPYDAQGFDYDQINCGPITVYTIEHYVLHALTNSNIEGGYNIPILFDQFRDHTLNKSVHEAFMYRLKIDHLSRIADDYDLIFRDEPAPYLNKLRSENVKKNIKVLAQQITANVTKQYEPFLGYFKLYSQDKEINQETQFSQLATTDQMRLLNRITEMVVNDSSMNLVNRFAFTENLKKIINVFVSDDYQPQTENQHDFLKILSGSGLQLILQSVGITVFINQGEETNLIKVVKHDNYDLFKIFIQSLKAEELQSTINSQDHNGMTALLHSVLLNDERLAEDLVKNGADIYLTCTINQVGIMSSYEQLNAIELAAFEGNIKALSCLIKTSQAKAGLANIITEALQKVLSALERHQDKFQREDIGITKQLMSTIEEQPVERCAVVELLLRAGADPFKVKIVHSSINFAESSNIKALRCDSALDMVCRLKSNLASVFFKYFPDKIKAILLAAINNKNLELVSSILLTNPNITKEIIKEALTNFNKVVQEFSRSDLVSSESYFSNNSTYDKSDTNCNKYSFKLQ